MRAMVGLLLLGNPENRNSLTPIGRMRGDGL